MADHIFPSGLKIILVEDSADDAELIIRRLKKEGFPFDCRQVMSEPDYLDALKAEPDLILSDWSLPHFSGLRALQLLRERDLDMPFIIVSGNIGEEAAIDAMRHGCQDYILKDRPERLGQAVRKALEQKNLRDERKRAEALLRLQSAALNAAANAIVITDLAGKIEWVNPAFSALTGFSADEAIGKNPSQLIKSGVHDREFFSQFWNTILAGKVWHGEIVNQTKDGCLYTEEQTITPVINSNGQIERFIAIKQDISDRKRAEEAIQRRTIAIQYLYETAQKLSQTLDLNSLYQTLYHAIAGLMEINALYISSFDPVEKQIRCMFAMQDERVLDTSGFPLIPLAPEGHGAQSRVIHSRKPLLVDDYLALMETSKTVYVVDDDGSFSDYKPPMDDRRDISRSAIIIPILLNEQAVGVIQIISYKPAAYTEDNLKMAEAMAAQFAVASSNAALYQQAQTEITERIQAEHALQKKAEELNMAYESTLLGWSKALELREQETFGHSERVVAFTLDLAREMGFDEEDLVHIHRGTLLHDIGKIGVPDTILQKPGPLDDKEWEIMRKHPTYAFQLLSGIPYLAKSLVIPYSHHERWDGSGYPLGLKGEQIPLAARIFAVVDVWDALSYKRWYREAWPQERILKYLLDLSGKQFDPQVVEAFMRLYPKHQPNLVIER